MGVAVTGAGPATATPLAVSRLERHAAQGGLEPELRTRVQRISPRNGGWHLSTPDGGLNAPQAVIATGYRPGLEQLVGHLGVLDADGRPKALGSEPAAPGLWFAGSAVPRPGGLGYMAKEVILAPVDAQLVCRRTIRACCPVMRGASRSSTSSSRIVTR